MPIPRANPRTSRIPCRRRIAPRSRTTSGLLCPRRRPSLRPKLQPILQHQSSWRTVQEPVEDRTNIRRRNSSGLNSDRRLLRTLDRSARIAKADNLYGVGGEIFLAIGALVLAAILLAASAKWRPYHHEVVRLRSPASRATKRRLCCRDRSGPGVHDDSRRVLVSTLWSWIRPFSGSSHWRHVAISDDFRRSSKAHLEPSLAIISGPVAVRPNLTVFGKGKGVWHTRNASALRKNRTNWSTSACKVTRLGQNRHKTEGSRAG